VLVTGAVVGAQTGFVNRRRAGVPLLERSRSRRLRDGAKRAGEYLERYGQRKAIVLARSVPSVRTVLNPLAGAVGVPARVFLLWQMLGGAAWAVCPPTVAVVVVVSLLPLAIELVRERRRRSTGGSAELTVAMTSSQASRWSAVRISRRAMLVRNPRTMRTQSRRKNTRSASAVATCSPTMKAR
jgi:hypothetical protein